MASKEEVYQAIERYKLTHDDDSFQLVYKQYEPIIKATSSAYSTLLPQHLLEQEGKVILSQAMDRFDLKKENFTPYLGSYMKGMQRIANVASPIYVPETRVNKLRMYVEEKDELTGKLGRLPTLAEMADQVKLPLSEIKRLDQETGRTVISGLEENVLQAIGIQDSYAVPSDYVLEYTYGVLDSDTDKKVMEHVYGLHGKRELSTNSAIASSVGISETGVRNAKDRIIATMKEEFVR